LSDVRRSAEARDPRRRAVPRRVVVPDVRRRAHDRTPGL